MMTLEEFRKTGRNVRLRDVVELNGANVGSEFGRIYDGNCHIELLDDGSGWHLVIGNSEYEDLYLPKLEKLLYSNWYVHECVQVDTYQIEIRGRVVDKLNAKAYVPIARYDVIAASLQEACDLVLHDQDSEVVKRTMQMA